MNPCAVRFLNIKSEVGRESGSFDMAPYETRWASFLVHSVRSIRNSTWRRQYYPRSRAIIVVSFPDTQFNPNRMGYIRILDAPTAPIPSHRNYLAVCPPINGVLDRSIPDFIICEYVVSAESCQVRLETSNIRPAEDSQLQLARIPNTQP